MRRGGARSKRWVGTASTTVRISWCEPPGLAVIQNDWSCCCIHRLWGCASPRMCRLYHGHIGVRAASAGASTPCGPTVRLRALLQVALLPAVVARALGGEGVARVAQLAAPRHLGVDIEVILTPPCIFCLENCSTACRAGVLVCIAGAQRYTCQRCYRLARAIQEADAGTGTDHAGSICPSLGRISTKVRMYRSTVAYKRACLQL